MVTTCPPRPCESLNLTATRWCFGSSSAKRRRWRAAATTHIVVTVRGRARRSDFRKDECSLGSTRTRELIDAPSYLTVLSNRTINDIADINTLRRTQTGLARILLPQEISGDIADSIREDPFRLAFLRLKIERGFYRETQNGVTFLTPALFRAAIPLPDNTPTGSYDVDVKLFADGALLARQQTALEVVKIGFEQFVAQAAREHGLFYGLATALMALLTGWFASVVFRKD